MLLLKVKLKPEVNQCLYSLKRKCEFIGYEEAPQHACNNEQIRIIICRSLGNKSLLTLMAWKMDKTPQDIQLLENNQLRVLTVTSANVFIICFATERD